MENKINIAEILKDCPKGIELYSPLCGDCKLYDVNDYNIRISTPNKDTLICLYHDGRYCSNGEIMLFPKGKTTWEGFVPPCKFKDGDIVTCTNDACTYTAIFKEMIGKGAFCHYGVLIDNKFRCVSNDWSNFNETCRLATEEEKEKLFNAIKTNGYKWNEDTKTLEKLPKFKVRDRIEYINGKNKNGVKEGIILSITNDTYDVAVTNDMGIFVPISEQDEWELVPNKFYINTLDPIESKVLVRDTNKEKWTPIFWGFYDSDYEKYPYVCCGSTFAQCIPYEGNEHLLGTKDDCDEYYKTWEE